MAGDRANRQDATPGVNEILRAFVDGANFARCDIRNDASTTRVVYGRQALDDGRPPLMLSAEDAHSAFEYMYEFLGDAASRPLYRKGEDPLRALLKGTVDRCDIHLDFASFPTDEGNIVVISNRLVGKMLFDEAIAAIEADLLGPDALESLVAWFTRHEKFLARGEKYGYRIGVSPDLKKVIAAKLPADIASSVTGNLLDV